VILQVMAIIFFGFMFFIGTLICPSSAYAYIDPATGSLLLQGLTAAIISALLYLRTIREKIKDLFFGGKKQKLEDQSENME